jgi:hypothetical protein
MGIWDNYKKRTQEEKEFRKQATEGMSPVEKVFAKAALKINGGSSMGGRFLGAVADTLRGKGNKD